MFLASGSKVGVLTITKALANLARENLIYRKGNAWIIGQKTNSYSNKGYYTLICLELTHKRWRALANTRKTSGFVTAFLSETNTRGIRIKFVSLRQALKNHLNSESAIQLLQQMIQDLGDRYLGTLLTIRREKFSHMHRPIEYLCKLNKPVLWLDTSDEGAFPDIKNRNFSRLMVSEKWTAQKVLQECIQANHKQLGYLNILDKPWVKHRFIELHNQLQKIKHNTNLFASTSYSLNQIPPLSSQIETLHQSELKQNSKYAYFISVIKNRLESSTKQVPKVSKSKSLKDLYTLVFKSGKSFQEQSESIQILILIPSFLELIYLHKVSVILAPNDYWAYRTYRFLSLLKQKNISLIGFDNALLELPGTIATMDFGYNELGIAAVHRLMHPIKPGDPRNIKAEPKFWQNDTFFKL